MCALKGWRQLCEGCRFPVEGAVKAAVAPFRSALRYACAPGEAHPQATERRGVQGDAAVAGLDHFARDRQAQAASAGLVQAMRSEEHTSELQSLMRTSYAVFCLQKKKA